MKMLRAILILATMTAAGCSRVVPPDSGGHTDATAKAITPNGEWCGGLVCLYELSDGTRCAVSSRGAIDCDWRPNI